VVQLTSTQPMTEPFATLLVEATWARGRNLREYTVLFDPPVFAPQNAPSAPVAAATTGGGDRSGTIARPAPTQAAPAAPAPVAAAAGGSSGEYNVRSGDSLSAIAQRQYGAGQTDRGMIAIYRANPQAFEGNINVLRAGSVLRLPDQAAVAAVDSGDAASEVRRQAAAWTGGSRSGGAASEARLRLVPPGSPGAGGNGADTQALRERVSQLESELAESRRLLELRNAELARLQSSGRNSTAPAPTPTPAPAPVVAPPAATPAPAAESPAAAAPAVAEPAAAEPAKPKPKPVAKPAPEAEAPSLLDRLKDFWFVPVGLVALIALIAGLRAVRRRRETRPDMMAPFAVSAPAVAERDSSSDTFPLRKPVLDRDDPSIVVEESGTHERPVFPKKDTRTVDLDEGTASMIAPALDATAALEQGDPLAEADFHMAYGLYDQAADLVKMAIQREPDRRDLKQKLLEVFFVWGNKDQFLQTARDLADSRDQAQPGEWEKVVIMGKQLAPEDALFSQSYSGAGPATVDLNLEGGQNLIDFDLHGEPGVSLTPDGGVDMDLGSTMPGNKLAPNLDAGLDFMLDDPARGDDDLARTATTRQMVQPGFDGEIGTMKLPVEPTVEQPLFDVDSTAVSKLDAQANFVGGDQTAELALDDLGLDLGKLDSTNEAMLDDSRLTQSLSSPDAPTLVAGLDETSRRIIESNDANQPTELLPLGELPDSGATSSVALLDFELDGDAETGKRAAMSETDFNLDLDVGSAEQPVDGEYQRTQRIEPSTAFGGDADAADQDMEPVTMSEVGTKLDLARAYMDMGDPDGARSILTEVLQEGSSSQKQEAQRLIDSIPG
jgi:pilus assembly protein FimV